MHLSDHTGHHYLEHHLYYVKHALNFKRCQWVLTHRSSVPLLGSQLNSGGRPSNHLPELLLCHQQPIREAVECAIQGYDPGVDLIPAKTEEKLDSFRQQAEPFKWLSKACMFF